MPNLDNQTIAFAFIVVTGLAVLLQTLILVLIFVAMRKAAKSIREETAHLRSSIMPVIFDARDLVANSQATLANAQEFLANAQSVLTRVTPRIESTTTNIVEVSHRLREQTAEMQGSALEIMDKVRRQSERIDEMCSRLLDTVDYAGGYVVQAVGGPLRQASGILRAVKAIVGSLRTPVTRR
jgi:paraquat-inducible protein B